MDQAKNYELSCVVVVEPDHELRGTLGARAFACGRSLSVTSVSTADNLTSLIQSKQIETPCMVLATKHDIVAYLQRIEPLKTSPIIWLAPEDATPEDVEAAKKAGATEVETLANALREGGCERLLARVRPMQHR